MRQLSESPLHACFRHHRTSSLKHLIGAIQLTEIPFNGLVNFTQFLAQLATRIVLGLGVDRLEPAAINSDQVRVQQIDIPAQRDELLTDLRIAGPLSLRKSAMVLKSGRNRPVSQMSSRLRPHSRSSRRED